jgi:hypothetical protein
LQHCGAQVFGSPACPSGRSAAAALHVADVELETESTALAIIY